METNFIKKEVTMTFDELEKLLNESKMIGYQDGIFEVKHNKDKYFPPRAPKPASKVTTPQNNKKMLEKFLGGAILNDEEANLLRKNIGEEQYRKGFNDGAEAFKRGSANNFDPKIHIDNSVYGWASKEELSKINLSKGHATILRNKNEWAQEVETVFVKITPIEGERNENES